MAIVKQRNVTDEKAHQMLVSQVSKIASIDPLSFFTAGLKQYKGERFFWSDPLMEQVFVGLGTAYEIEAYGDERFNEVEREWRALLGSCVTESDSTVKGTGPLLFGGFSFDPAAAKTALWRSFPDARLTLPKFLLTVKEGECWLTANRIARPDSRAERQAERMREEQERLVREARAAAMSLDRDTHRKALTYSLTDIEPDAWKRAVHEASQQIQSGVMDKVALAREIRVTLSDTLNVAHALRRLCEEQAESYVFAVERGNDCFLGASPERLVKRDGDKFYSVSLASSIGRGKTKEEDIRLGQKLLQDEKFLIEHKVVVDMIKAAMEECCDEVDVPSEPSLFKAAYIQHLYTPVIGKARKGTTLLSMVKKLHPTPALGGFPQSKAVRKIRELEMLDRGWYAAPLGWINESGDGEFIGAIRSGLIRNGREVSLFVGNGIVGDSEPESEFEETKLKPRPMLSALGGSGS